MAWAKRICWESGTLENDDICKLDCDPLCRSSTGRLQDSLIVEVEFGKKISGADIL